MNLLATLHGRVFERRLEVLARALSEQVGAGHSVLDLGCGDGRLGTRILELRPDLRLVGCDTMSRLAARIPAFRYDGADLPLPDNSVDAVIIVDVLHHTDDPVPVLQEAVRVARRHVILKDHLREGFLSGVTLRFMDWVGNARYGVALPYNYLSSAEWSAAFSRAGLEVESWRDSLGLYPAPLSWAFDRSLHFVSRLGIVAAPLSHASADRFPETA
jgi:SAM-dependent methyltransferase